MCRLGTWFEILTIAVRVIQLKPECRDGQSKARATSVGQRGASASRPRIRIAPSFIVFGCMQFS